MTGLLLILLSFSPQNLPEMRAKVFAPFSGTRPQRVALIDSLVNQVSADTLYRFDLRLQDFQTRYSYTDSVIAAAHWIRDQFLAFGYDSVYFDSFPHPQSPSHIQLNVVAVKVGDQDPDRVVLMGGHYDSVVYGGGNPYTWAPGADDNGSGTSATLETARVLAGLSTDKTLYFVAFAAEEQGLYGSDHFAGWAQGNGLNIDLMINLDMVAYEPNNFWNVISESNYANRDMVDLSAAMAQTYTELHPQVSYTTSGYSDHWPFLQHGYPAIFISEGDFNWNNWHEPTDVVDSLNFPYLAEVTRMALATALWVSERPDPPQNLLAENVGDGSSIRITVLPPTQTDLMGFRIRYSQTGGPSDSLVIYTDTATIHGLTPNIPVTLYAEALDSLGFVSEAFGPVTITPSVSVAEEGPESPGKPQLSLYPDGQGLQVTYTLPSSNPALLELYTPQGRRLFTKMLPPGNGVLEIPLPHRGVYFVLLRGSQGQTLLHRGVVLP